MNKWYEELKETLNASDFDMLCVTFIVGVILGWILF